MRYDEDTPHIQACCADCGFVYDLRYGLDCARCNSIRVAWARQITTDEYKTIMHPKETLHDGQTVHRLHAMVEQQMREECNAYAGEQQDIRDLDRMYNLEDTRRN